MPTFSHLTTRTVSTSNSSSRFGVRPQYIVLHHMASTGFEGVLSLWSAARKQGSAHYAISNAGQVVGVVPEERRAWSLSSASFDSKAIVFEIANESMGGTWPVSAKAEEATARVVADICTRYGIPITRACIIGHREVFTRFGAGYATACPGGLDLDGIVARAKAISAGITLAGTTKLTTTHKRRNKSMSTGYWTDRQNRTPPVATDWALAGDGQGEAAWLPVSGPTAQDVAEVHGPFVYLNVRSYDSFKARYLSGGGTKPTVAP